MPVSGDSCAGADAPPALSVYTSDGRSLGTVEAAGRCAFKVVPGGGRPGFWLWREAIGQVNDRRIVLRITFDEIDEWRWTPPPNPLFPTPSPRSDALRA